MKNVIRMIAVSIFSIGSALFADTIEITDFAADRYGNVEHWLLESVEHDGDNGIKFSSGDVGVDSPVYNGAVLRLSLEACCINMRLAEPSSLQILGRSEIDGTWRECAEATFINGSRTNIVFAFPRKDAIRRLRIVFKKVSGTLRIISAAATLRADGEIETPSDSEVFEVSRDGFFAAWHVEDEVTSFRFRLWRS
jgi:hypothetical protein